MRNPCSAAWKSSWRHEIGQFEFLVSLESSGKFWHEMSWNMIAYLLENGIVMFSRLYELLVFFAIIV